MPNNTINAFRVVVTVSNGACINRNATVASLNALFPLSALTVTNTLVKIDYPPNSPNITLPPAGVKCFVLLMSICKRPGLSSTVNIENTPTTRPFFTPGSGFFFPTVGNSISINFNSTALISGFIEKPGTPASNCVNGINNSITNVTLSFKVPVGQCVPISNFTTGTTGQYSRTVLKGFDYDVTPSKTNGNQFAV
ncbi:MAG: hypothetical protein IPL27_09905 [Lewinellaceae bacterium]|nr:hypothetical protein [Lewinellaceae bacterium]